MRNVVYVIIFWSFFPLYGFSFPIWQRKIVNYERNQYKAGLQNWMITQSENGWIYCANSRGLLEFDGVNWTLYPVHNNVLRSVKIIDNIIYAGGSTEFGYYEHSDNGFLVYHSLSEKTSNWGGEVWNIIDHGENTYFLSERHIHIYNKKSKGVITINANVKIDSSVLADNVLYIGTPDGVFRLDKNNSLVFLQPSESLKGHKLVSLLPYNNKLLVTTARSGLYLIDDNAISKMQSIADDFISSNQLFCTSVSGTTIALGSVQNGIFIFDPENPSYKETFNLGNGLKNNTILSSFFDKEQNLWLGLDKGLSYINLNSPVRPLYATVSPIGTGYCSTVYNGELYLGTNQALYKVSKDGNYQLVKDSEGQIWSMNVIDNTLFCSGDNGITIISPTETYRIDLFGVWETHSLAGEKDRLIAGSYSGFYILKYINGRWALSHKAPDFSDSNRGFIEDEEKYTFWVVNTNSRIQKVSFNPEFSKVISRKNYSLKESAFEANTIFRIVDNNLIACTNNGIYRYSRINDTFERYTQLESMLEGAKYYEYLFVDKLKNIWFVADRQLKLLEYKDGEYKRIHNWGLSNELIDSYENIHLLDSSSVIVAVDNAFSRIDFSQKDNTLLPAKPHISRLVSSKNDSILSYGKACSNIEIPYDLNSIKIHFAIANYAQTSDILYSYRLKGVDDEWSIPSAITSKEYTNLPEGKHTFEVMAYTDGNTISPEISSITFKILPPWYRSPLAYVIYLILFSLALFLLYNKTIRKQKKIILQKGEELIAQNKRHEEETKLKDQEIYELQNENLKNELQYKAQELNGYILNVLRKNEMLEDVKKNAVSISKAIDEEKQISIIRQKVMRLISQINSNIEHDSDFKVFESNFDLIHQDFFKMLDEKYPGLTRNDKILCAYLKTNLSSKEIAPLLNISIRGVEVNRYRLRKKMNLDRDINLTEFLRKLK